jgi:hypothetical protein
MLRPLTSPAVGFAETLCPSDAFFTTGRCPGCFNRGTLAFQELLKQCTSCGFIVSTVPSIYSSPPLPSPKRPAEHALHAYAQSVRKGPDYMLPKPRLRHRTLPQPPAAHAWSRGEDAGEAARRQLRTAPALETASLFGMHRVGETLPHELLPLLGGRASPKARASTAAPSAAAAGMGSLSARGASPGFPPATPGAASASPGAGDALALRRGMSRGLNRANASRGGVQPAPKATSGRRSASTSQTSPQPWSKKKKRPPYNDPRPSLRRELGTQAEARTARWKEPFGEDGQRVAATEAAFVQARLTDSGVYAPPAAVAQALSTPSERDPQTAIQSLPSPRSAAAARKARRVLGVASSRLSSEQQQLAPSARGDRTTLSLALPSARAVVARGGGGGGSGGGGGRCRGGWEWGAGDGVPRVSGGGASE